MSASLSWFCLCWHSWILQKKTSIKVQTFQIAGKPWHMLCGAGPMVVLFRGHLADLIPDGHKEILSADCSVAAQGSSSPPRADACHQHLWGADRALQSLLKPFTH